MRSTNRHSFIRSLKRKGFKEEIVIKIGLYDLVTSTTLESNKSLCRHLHVRECQMDELWTFIAKKEARLTSLEKLAAIAGDAWVWIAFSPVDTLVLA